MTDAATAGIMARIAGPYQVLRGNRDLQLLFGSQVVSSFGDWLYIVALITLAYDLTGSATVVAVLTFVRLLPYALFLPFAGALADRWERKPLMIGADLGRAAAMFGLLLVVSPSTLWIAYPLVFLITTLSSLFRPAMSSLLPNLVSGEEALVDANTIWSQMSGLSFVLGPALGGLLVALGEPKIAFVVNAITFLVSAATLLLVRIPDRPEQARAQEEQSWLGETLAGFRFLFRENEGVLAAFTVAVAGMTLLGGAFWPLSVVLAEEVFLLGSEGTGYLNSAYGVGGLLGGFLVSSIVKRYRNGPTFIWSAVASSIVAGLFALSPLGIWPFLLIALLGITDVFSEITDTTIIQTGTPSELLGRVFGAYESTLVFSMLFGSLVVGPLVDLFGARAATLFFAVVGLAVLLVCLPWLRRVEQVLGVRVFIRQVPVLTTLPHRMLDDIASRMHLEQATDGEVIVHEGEHGDRLYIIKSGEAEVVARDDGAREVEIATLSTMDYFGEIALLRDVPRTATVRACGPLELYSLTRADFQDLLKRSSDVREAMTGVSDARYVETQSKLLLRR